MMRRDHPRALVAVAAATLAAEAAIVWWLASTRPAAAVVLLLAALVAGVLAIAAAGGAFGRRKPDAASVAPSGVSDELCQLIEAAHAAAWDRDVKSGRAVFFGDLQTTFGLDGRLRPATLEQFQRWVHPDDRARVGLAVSEAQANRTRYRATYRVVWPDGTVRWLDSSGQFYYDAGGAAVRMLGVVIDVTDRRLLEQTLHESRTMLVEIIESATDPILVLDDERRITLFNPAAERLFGCAAAEALGAPVGRFLSASSDGSSPPSVAPDPHRDHSTETCGGTINRWWARREGDEPFAVEASLSETVSDGRIRYTLILRDLRERLQIENALREGEQRFRLIADSAPVLLWVAGTDKRCAYVNRGWQEFTGRTLEQEIGHGWTEGVRPDHYQRCLEIFERAFDAREPFTLEYQLRRHDGQYCWMLASGVPRFGSDGAFAGYVGSAIDVTDLRSARSMLAEFGQRLLQAHETERTRIARELHDDIGQRMAVLTMDLDALAGAIDDGKAPGGRLRALSTRSIELARDIQALSHRLHSSKLDHLGLVSASAGLCRELSAQHGVQVAFRADGVPDDVPKNIALGVFRVLQEAIANALKHGRSDVVQAALNGRSGEIQLEVTDHGQGFDVTAAMGNGGLGLISMHERISLLHGELQVDSRRGGGTRVRATVPLAAQRTPTIVAIN